MFKKLKDKLAEEVKSSPQRIQQFAQAAQAVVTSASSSISDITNNDLFSIGDNENPQSTSQSRPIRTSTTLSRPEHNVFQDVTLMRPPSVQASNEEIDYQPRADQSESHNQRRLSNSSFASDVSFRLPSYESPSLYHLQSDMEVSASEAEERGLSSGAASLDRVTKEQLYAAYKRTQQRSEKYRTQYADLARHYKFLERDNAKARSVLVETQDKALRRISELREQCTLEQSAKAHLEKALRMDIDEKNMKIEALNTKISCMQDNTDNKTPKNEELTKESVNELELIDFSGSNERKSSGDESAEIALAHKTEKLEQLVNKYKESLKLSKEKNAQITTEMHILTNELENQNKENEQLKISTMHLTEARKKILELQEINEVIQNKLNAYEFNQMKEKSSLELDLQKALEEIEQLRGKIEIFNKREEEYAISLAENKLSIHKELESKEAEIKSLKDNLTASKNEIQSLNIVVNDYKKIISSLEDEKLKLSNKISEINTIRTLLVEKESQIKDLTQKNKRIEQAKSISEEEYKCLQLQLKQETAEKLAMIDRNAYLEIKNTQLDEENLNKSHEVNELLTQLQLFREERENLTDHNKVVEELETWRNKYYTMELEIQDEREELVKLQSEIDKLLQNHEVSQARNLQLLNSVSELTAENESLKENENEMNKKCIELINKMKSLKVTVLETCDEAKLMKQDNLKMLSHLMDKINKFTNISNEHETADLNAAFDTLKQEFNVAQNDLIQMKQQLVYNSKKLIEYQEANKALNEQINSLMFDKTAMQEEQGKAEKKYYDTQIELHKLKDDKSALLTKVNELENFCQSLQSTIIHEREETSQLHDKVSILEKDKNTLLQKNYVIEAENDTLKTMIAQNEVLKSQNEELLAKSVEYKNKQDYIAKIEDELKVLSQENTSLKNQSQNIASNLKALETEICDVRKSHAKMESEKDHLNSIIKKLEETEIAKQCQSTIEVQTDENSFTYESLLEENKLLKDKCEQFKQEKEILYEKVISVEHEKETLVADVATQNSYTAEFEQEKKSLNETNLKLLTQVSNLKMTCKDIQDKANYEKELEDKIYCLQKEYDTIKDENRRLTSDIEGLQMHLAKIAKENSTLNDKLREMIASSEHVDKNDNMPRDFSELQNGNQSDTDKMNDLVRENMLLVEENLELKDQLRSQNYVEDPVISLKTNTEDGTEMEILKEKYNNLLDAKSKYENQLSDLENINKSINGNMQSVQETNEKLRLSNEKLERRLDEALVSLRHLHSLQENTELEYLRNVLYEYLTGSGTHSITLAKVLAAVVKFDEMQTNIVLQKEKERQGLLRQLGLL